MDEVTLITLVLGMWGTALSTILGIIKYIETRQTVDVKISYGLIEEMYGMKKILTIEGVNRGSRPVKISSFALLLPDKKKLWSRVPIHIDKKLPTILTDGDSVNIHLDVHSISQEIINQGYSGTIVIRGYLSSPSRKKGFVSKKMKHNPTSWLNVNGN